MILLRKTLRQEDKIRLRKEDARRARKEEAIRKRVKGDRQRPVARQKDGL